MKEQDSSWKETFSRVDKLFTPGLNAAIQAKEEKILSFRGATGAFILNSPVLATKKPGELHICTFLSCIAMIFMTKNIAATYMAKCELVSRVTCLPLKISKSDDISGHSVRLYGSFSFSAKKQEAFNVNRICVTTMIVR